MTLRERPRWRLAAGQGLCEWQAADPAAMRSVYIPRYASRAVAGFCDANPHFFDCSGEVDQPAPSSPFTAAYRCYSTASTAQEG